VELVEEEFVRVFSGELKVHFGGTERLFQRLIEGRRAALGGGSLACLTFTRAGPMSCIVGGTGSPASEEIAAVSPPAATVSTPQKPSVLHVFPSGHVTSPTGQSGRTVILRWAEAKSGGFAVFRTCESQSSAV